MSDLDSLHMQLGAAEKFHPITEEEFDRYKHDRMSFGKFTALLSKYSIPVSDVVVVDGREINHIFIINPHVGIYSNISVLDEEFLLILFYLVYFNKKINK